MGPLVRLSLVALLASAVSCAPALEERTIATSYTAAAGQTFDYIIVGGGTAGLALASRLSEDPGVTVCVIEAGGSADDTARTSILTPSGSYYYSLSATDYDWGYTTTAQAGVGNKQLQWPRGKVLGGSSAVNGMYLTKGNQKDFDALEALNPGSGWNWNSMSKYMAKAETYTPPTQENIQQFNITYDMSVHGTSGPVHLSYPNFFPTEVDTWMPTLNAVGLPTPKDPASGDFTGSFIITSSIDPDTQERSYSKNAYIDGTQAANNTNLVILPGQQVTQVLFDSTTAPAAGQNLTATGIEFASDSNAPRVTVNATREVIICAGTIGSPQLLQVSGIGPAALLKSNGITTLVDLPGVGENLQDHVATQIVYATGTMTGDELGWNGTFQQEQQQLYANSKTGFYDYINNAVAYVPLSNLFGSGSSGLITSLQQNEAAAVSASSQDPTVQAGYKAQYEYLTNSIFNGNAGLVEMLFSLTGNGQTGQPLVPGHPGRNSIGLQVALQHPLSRGNIQITSNSIFDKPAINPNYFQQSLDTAVLRQALKFARIAGATAPMSSILQGEFTPGSNVQSDNDWEQYIAQTSGTEFHPSSSCAMLPLSMGGVVDTNLVVYGTNNLRVVDASILPLLPGAHLTMPVYGIAEKAADIIKARYNPQHDSSGNSTTPTTSSGSQQGGTSSGSQQGGTSSDATSRASRDISNLVILLCVVIMLI